MQNGKKETNKHSIFIIISPNILSKKNSALQLILYFKANKEY